MRLCVILIAAAPIALAIVASNLARGSLQFDLRVSSVTGPGIEVVDNKHILVSTVGGSVNFDLYAVVTGADNDTSNDGLQDARGYILAPIGDGPKGHLISGTLVPPFNGNGSVAGTNTDVNGDTFRDWGTADASAATSIAIRSNVLTLGGPDFRIFSFSLPISQLGVGSSSIDFTRTGVNTTIIWREDNSGKNLGNGSVVASNPVMITAVPEPASLAVMGVGALGLVWRRQKIRMAV